MQSTPTALPKVGDHILVAGTLCKVIAIDPPETTDQQEQVTLTLERADHFHRPVQHRDGKPKWCPGCGLTADYQIPESRLARGGIIRPITLVNITEDELVAAARRQHWTKPAEEPTQEA